MPSATDQNPLGSKPVGKLIATYAIPSIIAMLVNSLYNIVDQIFIGHGVGYLGNAATTIAFPIITVGLAIALILGNGCAAYISIKLGERDIKDADASLGSVFTTLILAGTIFAAVCLIFLDPLIVAVGATENIMAYSRDYVSIILIGQPFTILSIALANVIRADGSPRYSMMCMLVGALLNTALDPLFIFVFDMGVKGAAIATVISQLVSFAVTLFYFFRPLTKNVHLKKEFLRPKWIFLKTIMALGLSSFVTQVAVSIVNIVFNNALRYYGAMSPYGADIPLSAMGIVIKVGGIMLSFLIGISVGAQPVLGYNYGAKNYARVRKAYAIASITASIISVAVWACFMIFPDWIIRLFGDNSPDFVEFGALGFRAFQGAMFVAGFQIISANYFQATGRPAKATLLAMSRQILFLIPLILIMGAAMGIIGVLYSSMVADFCAIALTVCFIIPEMRRLTRLIREQDAVRDLAPLNTDP